MFCLGDPLFSRDDLFFGFTERPLREHVSLGGAKSLTFFLNPFWERLSQLTNIFERALKHQL